MMQPSSFRQYVDANSQHVLPPPPPSQIYSAVYSGVDVYEMEVNDVAVMRRRNDSWLNATQILKVAGIEKGKRTKVLEKEILIGEHEKVQGGYGKYQGTWIKFDRGLEFCRQYGVEDVLRPLLTYDMGQDGGIAGQGGLDTPTKEQAMAAQRKRLYNPNHDQRMGSNSGTFFKNISNTASNAVAAISKARFDSPAPRNRINGSRPASFSRQSSQQHIDGQDFPLSQQSVQSMQSFTTENSFNMGHGQINGNGHMNNHDSAYNTQTQHQFGMTNNEFEQPVRKRMRSSTNVSMSQQTEPYYDMSMQDATPTEPNDSFVYHAQQNMVLGEDAPRPLAPLPMANNALADEKRAKLMSLFQKPAQTDFSDHPAFLTLSGEDLDMPIDNTAHTALHWAATLARLPLLNALIHGGASIFRVNSGGETALMRACLVTNNLDNGSLPDLLEFLGPTIEMRDARGRTILHHIAVTSAVKGRSQCSKYYLESLLEFVVRSGSAPSSQQTFYGTAPAPNKSMGIVRFMAEIVNAQDNSGDTALNIAARIGNRSIISQLLEVGADAGIPNRAGLRPVDFGIGDPKQVGEHQTGSPVKGLGKITKQSSGDIISSIGSLLSETEKEFAVEMEAKQNIIDSLHAQLRDSSAKLGEERRNLEQQQSRANERAERKFKIQNLRRAEDDERSGFNALMQQSGNSENHNIDPMLLGDADASLALVPSNMPPSAVIQDPRLISSLPPPPVMRSRVNAYADNNQNLEDGVRGLKSKSRELESKYKRLIGVCVGVPGDRVEGLIEGLVEAVDSEREDVELARVRDFLVKVDAC